jgi:hypothetical protein
MTTALRRIPRRFVVLVLVAAIIAGGLRLDVFGVRTSVGTAARAVELLVDPPPDRPIAEAVHVTPRPVRSAAPTVPASSVDPSGPSQSAGPTPTPEPERVKVDVNLLTNPKDLFISEIDHEWCAVAGSQMVMAIHGKADLTETFQRKLAGRIDEWESRRDSLNGGWGPAAMVKALDAYGVPGYEVRAYDTRSDALFDAAQAIEKLHAPVLLLAWRGAHTWVMTGFRADADPLVWDDAKINGTYILDPWYPRDSSIWGQSDPPGTYQDASEMRRNYLPWHRPEGHYPDRDGLFIAVVPTLPLSH